MPPSSDGLTYTVGCRLDKFIISKVHLGAIQEAVTRVHSATFLATELANLHALTPFLTTFRIFMLASWPDLYVCIEYRLAVRKVDIL